MDKYKVTNSTVKVPRKDKDGKDQRTAVERVGHPVQFRDENDRPCVLQAAGPGSHTIVDKLDAGLLGLQRGGFVRIEKIADISTALQEHAYQGEQAKSSMRAQLKTNEKKATAVQMGLDSHQQKSGEEYDGAVNPDGDPNFLATSKKSRRKRGKDASGQGVGTSTQ